MNKTLFIFGSRSITKLPELVRIQLQAFVAFDYPIIIGDCPGVDSAVQEFLMTASLETVGKEPYKNVTVFYSGSKCRNNLGNWEALSVPTEYFPGSARFYEAKDIELRMRCDVGFAIWDGVSKGSKKNIEVLKANKKKLFEYNSLEGDVIMIHEVHK